MPVLRSVIVDKIIQLLPENAKKKRRRTLDPTKEKTLRSFAVKFISGGLGKMPVCVCTHLPLMLYRRWRCLGLQSRVRHRSS